METPQTQEFTRAPFGRFKYCRFAVTMEHVFFQHDKDNDIFSSLRVRTTSDTSDTRCIPLYLPVQNRYSEIDLRSPLSIAFVYSVVVILKKNTYVLYFSLYVVDV